MFRFVKAAGICLLIIILTGCSRAAVPVDTPVSVDTIDMEEKKKTEPLFTDVEASAVTVSTKGRDYSPKLTRDNDPATAWSFTGSSGQWIMLSAGSEQTVGGVRILNGYTKQDAETNEWHYYTNNRPKDITLTFSDGTYVEKTLEDVFDGGNYRYQSIRFEKPKQTTFIKLTVNSVYKGARFDDTCISEIQPYLYEDAEANPAPTSAPTPTPVTTPATSPAPSPDASGRVKLWEDGIYVTMRLNGDSCAVQHLVYDNYGDVVAQYYNFDPMADYICANEKSELALCYDYMRDFNIFSYEKLGYVLDDKFPFKAEPRFPGDRHDTEYEIHIDMPDDNHDDRVYTVTGTKGETLWQRTAPVNYAAREVIRGIDNEKYITRTSNTMIINNKGKKYEISAYKNESVIDVNDNLVFSICYYDENDKSVPNDENLWQLETTLVYRLVNYKTGEDISDVLENGRYSLLFKDHYIIKENAIPPYETSSILDENANLISENYAGTVYYLGHDLFAMRKGSYFGVINPKGEWLLRKPAIGED